LERGRGVHSRRPKVLNLRTREKGERREMGGILVRWQSATLRE